MISFTIKRFLALIPVAIGVIFIVSMLIYIVPGDPVDQLAGDYATAEQKDELRTKLGLNHSPLTRVGLYYKSLAKGDMGNSLMSGKPVASLLWERVGPTLELAVLSILMAILISFPLGILSAWRSNSLWDHFSMTVAMLGVSMPNFWLGPLLILFFSLQLDLFPVSERGDFSSYILPAFTLGSSLAAVLTRMIRTSILENYQEDYVRTARSKGLDELKVLTKHVLKNSSLPVLTILGLQFGVLLTGSIITEEIFDWPGLGSLFLKAIGSRDYPVVQGCVLLFSGTYVFINFLTDLGYAFLDPRIKIRE